MSCNPRGQARVHSWKDTGDSGTVEHRPGPVHPDRLAHAASFWQCDWHAGSSDGTLCFPQCGVPARNPGGASAVRTLGRVAFCNLFARVGLGSDRATGSVSGSLLLRIPAEGLRCVGGLGNRCSWCESVESVYGAVVRDSCNARTSGFPGCRFSSRALIDRASGISPRSR